MAEENTAEFESREVSLWMKNKEHAEQMIAQAEDQIIVNTEFVKMCNAQIKKLRRNHKALRIKIKK